MKQIIATVMMVCTLILAPFVSLQAPSVDVKNAVQILQVGENMCNTFPISTHGYWVTAGHCTTETPLSINGFTAEIVEVDTDTDIAVLKSLGHNDVLIVDRADRAPKAGDQTFAVGYPGTPKAPVFPLTFFGHVSSPDMILYYELKRGKMVLHEGGGPGMSGAPILNKHGKVVSIIQGGIDFPSNIVYGPTFADLMALTRKYWK